MQAQGSPARGDLGLRARTEHRDLIVGEARPLGLLQQLLGQAVHGEAAQAALHDHDLLDLVQEPGRDFRQAMQLLDAVAGLQRVVDPEEALGPGDDEVLLEATEIQFSFEGTRQPLVALLQGTHRLLQGLLEAATQGHDLTYALHLRAQHLVRLGELLEGEAGDLLHHVVQHRLEGGLGHAGDGVGEFPKSISERQLGGHPGDGEARGLGRQCGAAGDAGVHLDDDDAAGLGLQGELDVGAAGFHTHSADDGERGIAHALVLGIREREDGRHSDAVTGVDAHGIQVFDGADHLDVVVQIPHHLQLEFLPAENALLDEHLLGGAQIQAPGHDGFELLHVVGDAAAAATQREAGPDDGREARELEQVPGLGQVVGEAPATGLQAQVVHEGLEELAVLAALDGLGLGADEGDTRALEQAAFVGFHGQVQGRLATHRGQDGIGPFGLEDLLQHGQGKGFDVGGVGPAGIRHDRGRVGVEQNRPDALFAQSLQGLRARVVELAGLADLDGPRAEHQHAFQIRSLRHRKTFQFTADVTDDADVPSAIFICAIGVICGFNSVICGRFPSGGQTAGRPDAHRGGRARPRGGVAANRSAAWYAAGPRRCRR